MQAIWALVRTISAKLDRPYQVFLATLAVGLVVVLVAALVVSKLVIGTWWPDWEMWAGFGGGVGAATGTAIRAAYKRRRACRRQSQAVPS